MLDDVKFSVILGFMGQTRDRFQEFGPAYSLEQQIQRASQVELCSAVEIVYPQQLQNVEEIKQLLGEHGLTCSSVNVNIKGDPVFHNGSLTSPDRTVREKALEYLKAGMDIAPELGTDIVTCCPLGDGHEYAFQIDYSDAWARLVEGFGEAAHYRSDVRLSLEYKPNETRAHCVMGTATSALHICDLVGAPNLGVTIDIGHALYAGETPSLSISQLASAGKLFLVHVNDNYRNWDWDLVPGSVNWWDWLECLLYLDRVGYDSWLVSDVMPGRLDAIEVMNAVGKSIVRGKKLIARVDHDGLWAAIRSNNVMAAYDLIYDAMGLND